ncbi:MAG: hypothetical protein GX602_02070 [Dehalococcoidales bacterium]|nr:hypothetical protein [Dehalococcoidales bacterium]
MSKSGTKARVRANAQVSVRASALARAKRNSIGKNKSARICINLRVSGIGQGKELGKR